jgi:hypothetical protein
MRQGPKEQVSVKMPLSNASWLSVQRYDAAETRALVEISIPAIMAFRPVTFHKVGWPVRVAVEAELARYVDHNFETEVPSLFKPDAEFAPIGYRNAFTLDEQALIAAIRDRVADLTQNLYGRRIRPITNLLVQIGPFRMVQQLAQAMKLQQLSLFEVGPGAGYLGALLAETGHRYFSFDVAQSLYLWQSHLTQAVAGDDFIELAGQEGLYNEANALANGRVVHLPWWTYLKFLSGTSVRADVVYSNSNLSEMSNLALRHVLHISRHMLADSPLGLFCFFSKGMPSETPHGAIDEEFRIFGYHKAFESPFNAYTLSAEQAAMLNQTFTEGIGSYNPSGRTEIVSASEVVALRRDEAPLDVQLTQWLHGWQPPFTD